MDQDFAFSPGLPPLREHPLYAEGVAQLAAGQWQRAFEALQVLQGIYPEDAEVKELLDETQLRAALARSRPRRRPRKTRRLNVRRLIAGLAALLILAIAALVIYEVWAKPVLFQEIRLRQISHWRNEADEAITAGDYARARRSLQEVQALLPGDVETNETLRRLEQMENRSGLYGEAQALIAAGRWAEALEVLTDLQSLDAQYRDLPQLLQMVRENQALDVQFQTAEATFARGEWSTAIAQYETIRQADLTFRFDDIQARLFMAHLRYGQALLEEAGASPDQITGALSHFSEALKLRPTDAEALNERRLAEIYLVALNSADRDEAIDLLQTILGEQPAYAGNEAAGLLYRTLLERADAFQKAGDDAAAIADYETAARLPVEDPSQARERLRELTSETSP